MYSIKKLQIVFTFTCLHFLTIIIVAMGYSRQCLALSFLMLSLSVTGSYREIKVVLLLLSGIFFHNSLIFAFVLTFSLQASYKF